MFDLKKGFDVAKDVAAVIGTGYLVHKIYVAVDFVVAKAQAVKTALAGSATATTAAKTAAKS